MSDLPIRLALVGCRDDAVIRQDAAARLRGGCLGVIVDSLPIAAITATVAAALESGAAKSS